jgi:GNAT superfamily N-acetyltransferase
VVHIRPFEKQDREAVLTCIVSLQEYERSLDPCTLPGEATAAPYLQDLLENCHKKRGMVYVAESDGQIIGFVSMLVEHSNDKLISLRDYLYICDIFVVESHRGEGIGTALLIEAEQYARQMGCSVIQMNSLANNATALAIYRKFGFKDREILLSKELFQNRQTGSAQGLNGEDFDRPLEDFNECL